MAFYTNFCRLVGFFGGSWVTAVNLYYLLTYALAYASFIYLERVFGIESNLLLVFGGLTYSFWSFHYLHCYGHMTAIAYFVVPVFISICYLISQDRFRSRCSVVILIVLSAACGIVDIYYSFFGCFLFSVGLLIALMKKQFRVCSKYMISIFSVVSCILIVLSPAVYNMTSSGSQKSLRSPGEAYYWALQISSLFVPAENSGSVLRGLSFKIRQIAQIPQGENLWNYVGIIGILGFVIVIYWLFADNSISYKEKYVCRQLGATLLLGTVGGLSIFVAIYLTSSVRCYNRISTYVFAFLILACSLFADRYLISKKWGIILVMCLFLIHMIDMSPWNLVPDYGEKANKYYRDQLYFHDIDKFLEDGDTVLQLPYIAGYENTKIVDGIGNCNYHFRAYLLSKKDINWSFGGLSGTASDECYRKYDTTNVNDILFFSLSDHYNGIYLDKALYDPKDWEIVFDGLCNALGDPRAVSSNGELCYFDLEGVDKASLNLEPV